MRLPPRTLIVIAMTLVTLVICLSNLRVELEQALQPASVVMERR